VIKLRFIPKAEQTGEDGAGGPGALQDLGSFRTAGMPETALFLNALGRAVEAAARPY